MLTVPGACNTQYARFERLMERLENLPICQVVKLFGRHGWTEMVSRSMSEFRTLRDLGDGEDRGHLSNYAKAWVRLSALRSERVGSFAEG